MSTQNSSNASITEYKKEMTGVLKVLIHDGLGMTNCYKYLADYLSEKTVGTIIGIAIDKTSDFCSQDPQEVVASIADDYTECILSYGKENVQIIGYSFGGMIALEVARRLSKRSINVVDLVAIDSHHIRVNIQDELFLESLFLANFNITMEQVFKGISIEELSLGLVQIFEKYDNVIPEAALCNLDGDETIIKVRDYFRDINALDKAVRLSKYAKKISYKTGKRMEIC